MTATTKNPLQIVIATGTEDSERVILALETALTGASSGLEVSVFFTLRATQWACSNMTGISGGQRIDELVEMAQSAGATIEACSACLDKYCADQVRSGLEGLKQGIRPAGLASLVRRASGGANTITF